MKWSGTFLIRPRKSVGNPRNVCYAQSTLWEELLTLTHRSTCRGRIFLLLILNKKLYERHPLIFAEKSPFKIVCINLETPCIMGLLVRDLSLSHLQKILLYSTSDYSQSIGDTKEMLMCFFYIANLINYIFYLNKFFVSVLLSKYRQTTEKVYLFS